MTNTCDSINKSASDSPYHVPSIYPPSAVHNYDHSYSYMHQMHYP